jgi:L-glutamine:2-deoxy-scyllo-inosose/3-amino-2,3-dideoxy-scyllo-inosose aminotransferase
VNHILPIPAPEGSAYLHGLLCLLHSQTFPRTICKVNIMTTQDTLALLGGKPIRHEKMIAPAWPPISEQTGENLKNLYLSGQWSFNCPAEQAFAQDFAAYHTARHGVFMVNGTVTLEAALLALGVGQGDEVIVPALTWLATAMAVHYVGATPVFVDIEPTTLCIDPAAAEAAITPRTKAIIPVHLFNSMADMDAIMALARKHGLKVIEDCAHMQGGVWDSRGAGSIGDIGSFSFQQSKTLSSGEGGICLTSDDNLADRLYRIKHIGYGNGMGQGNAQSSPPAGLVCHNFRATGFQAVILQDQLAGLKQRVAMYDRNLKLLDTLIGSIDGLRLQSRGKKADPQGAYAAVIIADQGTIGQVSKDNLVKALLAEGLGVGGTYGVIYRHMLYNMNPEQYRIDQGSCPIAEGIGSVRSLSLPHQWLGAPEAELRTVASIFAKVASQAEALLAHESTAVQV